MPKKAKRVFRKARVTPAEAARLDKIRRQVQEEFPPEAPRPQPATSGIGAKIRAERQRQGLTWYAVAKQAGLGNPATVRDIEYGRDTKLSSVESIAKALGLTLDLVQSQ